MGILMVFTLFVHNIQNVHSKCAFRMLFHNVNSNYLFRLCVFRIFIQTIPSECFIKLFRMFIHRVFELFRERVCLECLFKLHLKF